MFIMLIKRWYVWAFLLCYFYSSVRLWGFKQTLKFLFIGFTIAWASEAISIRYGFPYGIYRYHYEAMPGEWMLLGVPVWDSLSYVFLAFFSYCFALNLQAHYHVKHPFRTLQLGLKTSLLSATYMMILDVIIDPVANQGDKWFLGKIYDYPHGGAYFGVPLSNFAGWWLVGFLMVLLGTQIQPAKEFDINEKALSSGVFFFFVVALFNLAVTGWIKDFPLLLASLAWFAVITAHAMRAHHSRNKIEIHIDA